MLAKDSIPADSLVAEKKVEEKPLLKLPTAETQLAHMRESGHWEEYRGGILPQMSEDAPEYCEKILQTEGKRFIIVDKAKMKLFLYDPFGNIEKSYGIACAKNYGTKHKKGDSRTTEGIFSVKGVFDSTDWLFTDDNGYTSPAKGQYGPRFIRLTIPYIGIHGTASPGSIGRRCSHGCIRVTNANIMELVKYVEEGMPVIISPGPKDMAVNKRENTRILAVATEPGGRAARPGWDEPKKEEISSDPEVENSGAAEENVVEQEGSVQPEPEVDKGEGNKESVPDIELPVITD